MADRNNIEVSTSVWLPREPTTPESNERTHFAASARASRAAIVQPGERQNPLLISNEIASLGCADRNFGFQFVRLACPLK
jgi:hypothetical protein